jgi:hypothetical protein
MQVASHLLTRHGFDWHYFLLKDSASLPQEISYMILRQGPGGWKSLGATRTSQDSAARL